MRAPKLPHLCSGLGAAAVCLALASCAHPLERTAQEELRESLLASHRAYLQSVADAGVIQIQRDPSEVEQRLSSERIEQLDQISGVQAYEEEPLQLGSDLLGRTGAQAVELSLRRAVELAMEHNLDVAVARLNPAIASTQLVQAQAVFDAVFFTTADWTKLDTPQPGGTIPGLASNRQSELLELRTGIRQPLITGGEASISTGLIRDERQPSVFAVDRFYQADVLLSLRQPLLRSFGADVNRAEIFLAQNAREAQAQDLRRQIIETAFFVEEAYWQLVLARQQLLIQQRLLERTIEDYRRLEQRAAYDVTRVRLTEAASFVELRRSEVIRARQQVRLASDRLKQLINAPDLPVSEETLILPVDKPTDASIRFSLLDAVSTALRQRPELQVALLNIDDASIRQRVADNARLPILDLVASVGFNGLSTDGPGEAYDRLGDLDFIDYLLRAQFEAPIGNRAAEALYEQRQLERRQAATAYRQAAQAVVLEVKNAMRDVLTSYELIGATRAARRAAAENLRALEVQEEAGVALTPEFLLDLKLNAQQRLADAETQEVQALTQYMTAIARLYQAMGTLLEQNNIVFRDEPGP